MRTWPGSLHSGHPEAGVAAVGALAGELTTSHPLDDAYGFDTPYARLVDLGGRVLMLGAPLDTATLIHHAETIASVPDKRRVSYGTPVEIEGERVWRAFSDVNTSEGALPSEDLLGEEDYIEHIVRSTIEDGIGESGAVGEATAHLIDAKPLVEYAVAWIEGNFATGERL